MLNFNHQRCLIKEINYCGIFQDVAKINVIEKPSGQVIVSLDGSNSQATIVREDSSTDIGVSFIPGDLSRIDLIYDPFGNSRPISNVSSGTLAGLVNFRSQILSPAMDGLDNLARVLTKEVNEIHTSGIDAKNQRGRVIRNRAGF